MKSICFFLALLLLLGLITADTHNHADSNAGNPELLARYPNFLVLISNTYELYWNYTEGNSRLDIAVRVKTTGWVGLGVSEKGSMVNSDLAVGWITNHGTIYLHDRFAGANGFPPEDTRNDLNLIRGEEKHGWTTLEFWRYLDTGDTGSTGGVNHDRIITEGNNHVVFAYGDSDTFSYHISRRGSAGVHFLDRASASVSTADSKLKTVKFRVHNITIPSIDTTYWCAPFHLPQEIRSSVKHMIRFAPIIHKPTAPYVHHMLLYSCDGIKMDGVTEEMLVGGPCFRSASLPWDSCMKGSLLATLSVGYDAYSFPEDVSFSFGGPQGTEYMMLQIHYNNPQMLKGVKDFSGIDIVYLDHPRKYDAGIMAIGHRITPFQLIPPEQDNFSVYGICDPSCTSKHIPRDGINVFSNLLHTHLAGRGLVLRQYRNGAEVTTPIDQDLNYDFNFQQIRTFPSRKIYPGDKIELQCKYSTSDRMKAVFGGLGTSQEMCLAFLYYYPRSPLLSCQSSLKTEALFQVLRLQKIARVSTSRLSLKQLQRTVSDPHFAWNRFSRATNLQALYKTTRTNISYLDLFCEVDDSMIHHQ